MDLITQDDLQQIGNILEGELSNGFFIFLHQKCTEAIKHKIYTVAKFGTNPDQAIVQWLGVYIKNINNQVDDNPISAPDAAFKEKLDIIKIKITDIISKKDPTLFYVLVYVNMELRYISLTSSLCDSDALFFVTDYFNKHISLVKTQ